jgi:hypothetical protein
VTARPADWPSDDECDDCENPREYRVILKPFATGRKGYTVPGGEFDLCGECARSYDDGGHIFKARRL